MDEYIASQPEAVRRILGRVRSAIRACTIRASKGTIRFPLSRPVPVKLIGRIAKFRAKEAAGRQKAKAASPRKR